MGQRFSICHVHLLSLSASSVSRAPTAALNQSFIRLQYLLLSDVTVRMGLDLSFSRSQEWQHNLCSPSFTKACRSPHQDVTESSKHKDYTQCQFRNLCRGAVIFRITILSIKNWTFNKMILNLKCSSLKRNRQTYKLMIFCWLVWSQWR